MFKALVFTAIGFCIGRFYAPIKKVCVALYNFVAALVAKKQE